MSETAHRPTQNRNPEPPTRCCATGTPTPAAGSPTRCASSPTCGNADHLRVMRGNGTGKFSDVTGFGVGTAPIYVEPDDTATAEGSHVLPEFVTTSSPCADPGGRQTLHAFSEKQDASMSPSPGILQWPISSGRPRSYSRPACRPRHCRRSAGSSLVAADDAAACGLRT